MAELLLERYGIVTREQVLAEGVPGGFSTLYDSLSALETLGICRRGYFVEGLGGAQFALPGAVERLRAQRAPTTGFAGGARDAAPVVLAATDPAQPYGAALPWPRREGETASRARRVRGAYVVLAGAEPVVFVEKGGRGLQLLAGPDDPRVHGALAALAEFVRGGRAGKLAGEGRRRAGGRLRPRAAAGRARLPGRPAQAHAERVGATPWDVSPAQREQLPRRRRAAAPPGAGAARRLSAGRARPRRRVPDARRWPGGHRPRPAALLRRRHALHGRQRRHGAAAVLPADHDAGR
ncbi:MAG: hypothetical protein R2736_01570 [Solirubrobacterales bacterium]